MIRVLVADDQDLVRAGIVATVDTQPDMTVVAEATDGEEAIRTAADAAPDLVLMDIRMPVLDGVAAAERILAANSSARVLILTTFDADELVHAALSAGACGYLVKDAPVAELTGAIRAAVRGDAVLSPAVTARVIQQLLAHPPVAAVDGGAAAAELPAAAAGLTERELDIVRHVADGLSNLEIARLVHLSEATVKTHMGRVLTKLGLRDRVQVAVWAHRTGIAQTPR